MKIVLSVSGMTCSGCEMHVEKAVSEIRGIVFVKASHAEKKLTIKTDDSWNENNENQLYDAVRDKVSAEGYEVNGYYSDISAAENNDDNFSAVQWGGILIILAAVFLIVKQTGIMNRIPVIESTMGYSLLFVIGIMTSLHCIGMCGSINLSVCASASKNMDKDTGVFRKLLPALNYNAGRVVSYTLVGALAGTLGSVVSITGTIQGIIVGAAGIFMVLMGLRLLGYFPLLDSIIPKIPKSLALKINSFSSGKGPFVVGFLNGFMPCGPLQSVQIYALGTGSAAAGAVSMFLFSIGTVPLMLGFGSITSIISPGFHKRILKISALLVLLLGGGMVLRGMSLSGVSLPMLNGFSASSGTVRIAEIRDGKQYVKTYMKSSEYEPFIVQKGLPVVWTIYADEEELNGCNNPLTVPEYKIKYKMEPGDNIIEFTPPDKEGTIIYTCWMGMITSGIKVVDDIGNIDESLLGDAASLSESSGSCSSGGCGSSAGGYSQPGQLSLSIPEIDTESIQIGDIEDGIQNIKVSVDKNGFSPAVVVLQKGLDTEWNIFGNSLNEKNSGIFFPTYKNSGIELQEGDNVIKFVPDRSFPYLSMDQDYIGYVYVVDDIQQADIDDIKSRLKLFNSKFRN